MGAPPRDPRLDLNLETGKRGKTRERRGKDQGQKGEPTGKTGKREKYNQHPFVATTSTPTHSNTANLKTTHSNTICSAVILTHFEES